MGPSVEELEGIVEKTPTLPGLGPAVDPAVAPVMSTAVLTPLPASIAHASAASIALPRHRRNPLLRAAVVISVATMFVLGWWWEVRSAPPPVTPAVATSVPGRTLAHGVVRTLAPSAEPAPEPQTEVAEPEAPPEVAEQAPPPPQPEIAEPAPQAVVVPPVQLPQIVRPQAPQFQIATPAPQHVASPAPTHPAIAMPPPAAATSAGAPVYEPMGI